MPLIILFKRKGGRSSSGKGGKTGSSSSSAKSHGASDAFLKSSGAKSFSLSGTKSSASAYSDGGGKASVLSSSSAFPGRLSGGSSRDEIYGSSRYGSGYPYGEYGSYVDDRPFPYTFYPVPVYPNYYGCDEYRVDSSERPGGYLATAIINPVSNPSSVTFRITGDFSSVDAVMNALVANTTCGVVNSTDSIGTFTPGEDWPYPEQVVQYYRASTFMLSLDSYNNTAALASNAPASNTSSLPQIADTVLPAGINMTLLQCINATIAASVPLVEATTAKHKFPVWAITMIVIVGGVLVILVFTFTCKYCKHRQRQELESVHIYPLMEGKNADVSDS